MIKLSVIIVSYQSDAVILDCLDSIQRFNDLGKELEVVVVDNFQNSNLSNLIESIDYGFLLNYKLADDNRGFGAGNNMGVNIASGEVMLFLNPDTILIENIFADVYEAIHSNSHLIYGFSLIDKLGRLNNSYSFFYDSYIIYHALAVMKMFNYCYPIKKKWTNKYLWPWGAAFAINKEVFVSAGCFDENIFLCNEEPDLMQRIPQRHVYISDHKIIHLEGSGDVVSEYRYYNSLISFDYYMKKYNISFLNRFLWDIYIKLKCWRINHFSNTESERNYVKAYRRFKQKKL